MTDAVARYLKRRDEIQGQIEPGAAPPPPDSAPSGAAPTGGSAVDRYLAASGRGAGVTAPTAEAAPTEAPAEGPAYPPEADGSFSYKAIRDYDMVSKEHNLMVLRELLKRPNNSPEQIARINRYIEDNTESMYINKVEEDRIPGSNWARGTGELITTSTPSAVDFVLGLAQKAGTAFVSPQVSSEAYGEATGLSAIREPLQESQAAAKTFFNPQGYEGLAGQVTGAVLGSKPWQILNSVGYKGLAAVSPRAAAIVEAGLKPGATMAQRFYAQAVGAGTLDVIQALNVASDPGTFEEKMKNLGLIATSSLAGSAAGTYLTRATPKTPTVKVNPEVQSVETALKAAEAGLNPEAILKAQQAATEAVKKQKRVVNSKASSGWNGMSPAERKAAYPNLSADAEKKWGALEPASKRHVISKVRAEVEGAQAVTGEKLPTVDLGVENEQLRTTLSDALVRLRDAEAQVHVERRGRLAAQFESTVVPGFGNKSALDALRAVPPDHPVEYGFVDLAALKAANDGVSHEYGTKQILEASQALAKAATEGGLHPRNLFHISGDEFVIVGNKGQVKAILDKAAEYYGVRKIPGFNKKVNKLDYAVHQSFQEADAALSKLKKGRPAELQREAPPDTPVYKTMDEAATAFAAGTIDAAAYSAIQQQIAASAVPREAAPAAPAAEHATAIGAPAAPVRATDAEIASKVLAYLRQKDMIDYGTERPTLMQRYRGGEATQTTPEGARGGDFGVDKELIAQRRKAAGVPDLTSTGEFRAVQAAKAPAGDLHTRTMDLLAEGNRVQSKILGGELSPEELAIALARQKELWHQLDNPPPKAAAEAAPEKAATEPTRAADEQEISKLQEEIASGRLSKDQVALARRAVKEITKRLLKPEVKLEALDAVEGGSRVAEFEQGGPEGPRAEPPLISTVELVRKAQDLVGEAALRAEAARLLKDPFFENDPGLALEGAASKIIMSKAPDTRTEPAPPAAEPKAKTKPRATPSTPTPKPVTPAGQLRALDAEEVKLDAQLRKEQITEDDWGRQVGEIADARGKIKNGSGVVPTKPAFPLLGRSLEELRAMQQEAKAIQDPFVQRDALDDIRLAIRVKKPIGEIPSLTEHLAEVNAMLRKGNTEERLMLTDRYSEIRKAMEGRKFPSALDVFNNEKGAILYAPDPLEKVPAKGSLSPEEAEILDHIVVGRGNVGVVEENLQKLRHNPIGSLKNLWTQVDKRLFSSKVGLSKVSDILRTINKELPPDKDPALWGQLFNGWMNVAHTFFNSGPFRWVGAEVVPLDVKPMRAILAPMKGKLPNLRAYMTAASSLDRVKETGFRRETAIKVVENAQPDVKQAAAEFTRFENAVQLFGMDSGLMDRATYDLIVQMHKHHVPFARVFEGEELQYKAGELVGTKTPVLSVEGASPKLKRFVGSKLQILDPIETGVRNTRSILRESMFNKTGLALLEAVEKQPTALRGIAEPDESVKLPTAKNEKAFAELKKALESQGIKYSDEALDNFVNIMNRESLTRNSDKLVVYKDGKPHTLRVDKGPAPPRIWG